MDLGDISGRRSLIAVIWQGQLTGVWIEKELSGIMMILHDQYPEDAMLRKTLLRLLAIALLFYARSAAAQSESMKKVKADIEAAHVLINRTMRDWWDASVSVRGQALIALRGGSKILLWLTREQRFDWTSASIDLGQCMDEHTFPHADPEAFRPDTLVKIAFEACMKQLHVEPSAPNHPNGPNWQPSEEFKNKVKADIEAANTLINRRMRDWWDASVRAQERAVSELRGGEKPGLTAPQLYDYTSANMNLERCMREPTFPHADPEAFRPETTVKVAFEACMKQLHIEPSTDPDHPNGPNWRRSESAERIRQRLWEWDQQKQKQ